MSRVLVQARCRGASHLLAEVTAEGPALTLTMRRVVYAERRTQSVFGAGTNQQGVERSFPFPTSDDEGDVVDMSYTVSCQCRTNHVVVESVLLRAIAGGEAKVIVPPMR